MFIGYHQLSSPSSNNIDDEGVGAQYQRIISLLCIAKKYNLKYFHIKPNIGHNYNNVPLWHDNWDDMFNIKKLADNFDNEDNQNIDLTKIDKNITRSLNKKFLDFLLSNINNSNYNNKLYLFLECYEIFDSNIDFYFNDIQNDLIKYYDVNNFNRKLIYDKNKINIAIHIRVYNDYDCTVVTDYNNYKNNTSIKFYMNSDKYIQLINSLKIKYPNSDIHIFSQEKYFDLCHSKLRELKDIKFHFNDLDTFDTFHHLCKADVFCMGTSSLSILAAFYNKNKVIYLPYVHPPLSKWEIYIP